MDSEDRSIFAKHAYKTITASLLGWLFYALRQHWASRDLFLAYVGFFFEMAYYLCVFVLMPFAFSGLLLAIIDYIAGRLRGYYGGDLPLAVLFLLALAAAFYVTAPVLGEAAIIVLTVSFLILRLIKRYLYDR